MKRLLFLVAMIFIFASGLTEAKSRYGGVNFNYFYSSLSPYGEWIEIDYDVYAWRPFHVGRSWTPYKTGRWVWSDYGWYWDSYEPFGWAVYHYGRWYFDDYYGWIWIPDYDWGPAWVEWRYDDDYIGWAPLPPYAIFDIHVGIHFTYDWHFPHHHWHYVKYNHFTHHNVHNYYVPDKYKYRIHARSKHRNDYSYNNGRIFNRGVDRDFVERRSGSKIGRRNLTEVSRLRDNDGSRNRNNDRIEIFRPGDDEVRKSRDIEKYDIKRSERRSSLDVSKVRTRENINTGRKDRSSEVKRNDGNDRKDRVEIKREDSRRNDRRNELKNVPERKVEISRDRKNEIKAPVKEMRNVEVPERNKIERNRIKEEPEYDNKRVERNENSRVESNKVERKESPKVEVRERRESETKVDRTSRTETKSSSGNDSRGSRSGGERKERTRR